VATDTPSVAAQETDRGLEIFSNVTYNHVLTTYRDAWLKANPGFAMLDVASNVALNNRFLRALAVLKDRSYQAIQPGVLYIPSRSQPGQRYIARITDCDCPDHAKAPFGWCKHRIAAWLHKHHKEVHNGL
jgi:hypothetical protein